MSIYTGATFEHFFSMTMNSDCIYNQETDDINCLSEHMCQMAQYNYLPAKTEMLCFGHDNSLLLSARLSLK